MLWGVTAADAARANAATGQWVERSGGAAAADGGQRGTVTVFPLKFVAAGPGRCSGWSSIWKVALYDIMYDFT